MIGQTIMERKLRCQVRMFESVNETASVQKLFLDLQTTPSLNIPSPSYGFENDLLADNGQDSLMSSKTKV